VRGGRHVGAHLESRRDLEVSVFYVWLPMFPRLAERSALPGVTQEFDGTRIGQYWDDGKSVGREFKERIIPGFDGDVAWDVWVLFDEEATWDSAAEHVVGWGYTVVATEQELFSRLESVADR
jgi:hypothetical protein